MKEFNLKKTLEKTNGRITIKFIATMLGRTQPTVSRWVNGHTSIPAAAFSRLVEILEKNEVTLVYDDVE